MRSAAEQIVVATHFPMLERFGLYDLRLRQENGGAGVTVSPVCFLIITKDGSASILGINAQADSTVDRLVEMIPGAINKVSNFVSGFKGKTEDAAAAAEPLSGDE